MTNFKELYLRLYYILLSIIISFIICFIYSEELFYKLAIPLTQQIFIYTHLTETLETYLKISFIISCILTWPIILIQMFIYINPGLYKYESNMIYYLLITYIILFVIIIVITKIIILPIFCNYFIGYEFSYSDIQLKFTAKINEYLFQILNLFIYLILILFIPFFPIYNLTQKFNILISLIIGGFLSPPDIISQLIFTLPLFTLFELIRYLQIIIKYL